MDERFLTMEIKVMPSFCFEPYESHDEGFAFVIRKNGDVICSSPGYNTMNEAYLEAVNRMLWDDFDEE